MAVAQSRSRRRRDPRDRRRHVAARTSSTARSATRLPFERTGGLPVRLRVVATLSHSLFQSDVIIADAAVRAAVPGERGLARVAGGRRSRRARRRRPGCSRTDCPISASRSAKPPIGCAPISAWRTPICRRSRRSARSGWCSARSGWARCCCATFSSASAKSRCCRRWAIARGDVRWLDRQRDGAADVDWARARRRVRAASRCSRRSRSRAAAFPLVAHRQRAGRGRASRASLSSLVAAAVALRLPLLASLKSGVERGA